MKTNLFYHILGIFASKLSLIGFTLTLLCVACAAQQTQTVVPTPSSAISQTAPNETTEKLDTVASLKVGKEETLPQLNQKLLRYSYEVEKHDALYQSFQPKTSLQAMNAKQALGKELPPTGKKNDRIIMLVHGFDDKKVHTTQGFGKIRKKLQINSQDKLLHFYWNKYQTKKSKGWNTKSRTTKFNAPFQLQSKLSDFQNKHIVIISHRKGASFLIKALCTPPYEKAFMENLAELGVSVENNCLIENKKNNKYYCIFLNS